MPQYMTVYFVCLLAALQTALGEFIGDSTVTFIFLVVGIVVLAPLVALLTCPSPRFPPPPAFEPRTRQSQECIILPPLSHIPRFCCCAVLCALPYLWGCLLG